MDTNSKNTARQTALRDSPKTFSKEEVSSTAPDDFLGHENSDGSSNESICQSVNEMNISSEKKPPALNLKTVEDFIIPKQILPSFSVPEKIIIVYDCAKDEVISGFDINDDTIAPDVMLKRSLRFFLHNKHSVNPKHEFALAILNENSVVWATDFTNNIESIIRIMDDISNCEAEDIISLNKLFELIDEKVNLSLVPENINIPPHYIVRVLFVYGRSFTLPQLDITERVQSILSSPYFTFDVLMTHEFPSPNNNCAKIFEFLQSLDKKGFAHFFPVARNAFELHLAMAKLLSHPLQRPCQSVANYSITKVARKVI